MVEAFTTDCAFPRQPTDYITDEWFSYDPNGRLTDVYQSTPHSGGNYHTTASYFANGVVNTLGGIPGQTGFTFGVDSEGRQATAIQGSNNLVSNTTFDPSSRPLTVTLGLGDMDTYEYYPDTGRLKKYTFAVGAAPNTKSMTGTLTWNLNGSLSSLAVIDGFNAGGTHTCKYGDPSTSIPGYDQLGRLIKVDCGANIWQQNFSYDAFGNLTKTVPTGGTGITWIPGYNSANNHYTLAGTSYDAAGNLLTDTFHTYTWDANRHPATIDSSACGTNGTCLTNDALDRPVEKSVAGAYTQILYSPVGKLAAMNGQALVNVYVPLPGGATYNIAPGAGRFWHKDWLGSVRLSTTKNNRTVDYDRAFAPFGEVYKNFGATTNYDFTGDTQDTIAGTYDTSNRELNPNQGRWLSPDRAGIQAADPRNPQSWNRYAYVLNNPLSNIDPSGLECVWDDGSFDAADDPKTGNAKDCAGQGGSWVNPDLFENAMLTNGQWNSNYGDWSASSNSTLAENWIGGSAVFGGPNAAAQEVDEALGYFFGNGAKPTIVYPPNDPFTLDFQRSLGMQAILVGVTRNCSATSGRVPVGTGEAFVNTMIDGEIGGPDGRGAGFGTPEAQMGAFNSTYSRSGGVVNITVTNPITLNSAALHMTAPLGIPNPTSGRFGTVNQEVNITAPDPCQ
jgi:RHS repeat-associated protein